MTPSHTESGLSGHRRLYSCPECPEDFPTPELLAPHLERHSPVKKPMFSKRGKPRSKLCPKGCGRYFGTRWPYADNVEMSVHVLACDGSKPIKSRFDQASASSGSGSKVKPRAAGKGKNHAKVEKWFRSDKNPRRFCFILDCGHVVWETMQRSPTRRKTMECRECLEED